jgi:hypothetical protein
MMMMMMMMMMVDGNQLPKRQPTPKLIINS